MNLVLLQPVSSVAVSVLHGRIELVVTETIWPTEYKIFTIWLFMESL